MSQRSNSPSELEQQEQKILDTYLASLFRDSVEVELQQQVTEYLIQETQTSRIPETAFVPKKSESLTETLKNSPYTWAQQPFSVVFMCVSDVVIGIPLVRLNRVFSTPSGISHMPGYPDWYLGMFTQPDGQYHVANGAWWLLPDNEKHLAFDLPQSYIVCGVDSSWGFTCQEILDTEIVDPKDVKWRPIRQKNPWFAGTYMSNLCTLINPDVLSFIFQRKLPQQLKEKAKSA